MDDPPHDVRAKHPPAPGVEPGTFDLVRVEVRQRGALVDVEATFSAPVLRLELPAGSGTAQEWFLPTVDVYLDTAPGAGSVPALAGRGFFVPAGHAWDHVLVLGRADQGLDHRAVTAIHLTARGRVLRGTFPASALPGPILGAVAVVLATSNQGEGGIRPIGVLKGDCTTWDDRRCTLIGVGPPVLDATGSFDGDVLALRYGNEAPPTPKGRMKVAFWRELLVTIAPIDPGQAELVRPGALATLQAEDGTPVGTAVVDAVVGDAATLRILGGVPPQPPVVAVFAPAAPPAGPP